MLKPPKSAEVNTHNAKVRFLVKFVTHVNSLETRIEQLKEEVFGGRVKINSLETRIKQLEKRRKKPKHKDVAPPEKTETKNKETKNEK